MENEKFQTPSWLEALRKEFPVTEKWAYFDSAYETGGAYFLEEASRKYFADKSDFYPGILQMGGSGKGKAIDLIEETRTLLAEFLNARDGHSIAFTANTCQAVALALQSYPFEPGDNVVVGDMEHVCVLYPAISLKQRGVEVRLIHPETEWGLTAEKLLEQVDDHTRFVVVSYVQSASGYRIDLEKLVRECHKKNCYVVTDAIQLLGFQKMDVKALGVDAVAASGYKGLLSIEGGGFLYVADNLLEKLRPWSAGPNPALVINRENGTWTCKDVHGVVAVLFDAGQHVLDEVVIGADLPVLARHADVALVDQHRRGAGSGALFVVPDVFALLGHHAVELEGGLVLLHAADVGRDAVEAPSCARHLHQHPLAFAQRVVSGQLDLPAAAGKALHRV